MKKLLLVLLFVPLVSFGQKVEDNLKDLEAFKALMIGDSANMIDRYGFFEVEPYQLDADYGGVPNRSFFKGSWWGYLQNNRLIIKILEETLGMPVFNSGPHKEYFKSESSDFGHYNPMFLEKVIKTFQSLSPISKKIIQPFYDSHFKIQFRELMKNQISVYFNEDSNKNFLEQIRNRDDYNSLVQEIKASNSEIPFETLFWIRRNYDDTSDKFLKLFELIIEEFDVENYNSSTFLEKYNNTIWTDGLSTIRFRKLSSIKYTESIIHIKGYVFDGFLKKSTGNISLYYDQGYFVIKDNIESIKNIYAVNSKSGLNVRESPSSSGKIVSKLNYGIFVKVLSTINNKLTINDIDNETEELKEIDGKWVEIETYSPPSGHRQELFADNNGFWYFTYKVDEMVKYLECHMCGYKSINKNAFDKLSFSKKSVGDFGPATYVNNTFSIENNELIEVENYSNYDNEGSSQTIWIPIDSDSIDIERIKDKNKIIVKEYTQEELDSISERKIEIIGIMEEEMELEEEEYYYFNLAKIIENPKSAIDFFNNGMIKFIKFQDYISAIEDLNKAIELNGDKNEWWIKLAYFSMGNAKGILNSEGACNDWKKAANLGFYSAKKLVKEKCN